MAFPFAPSQQFKRGRIGCTRYDIRRKGVNHGQPRALFRCDLFSQAAVLGFVIELYEQRGLQMSTAGVYLAVQWP